MYRPVGDSTDYDDSDWTREEMESLAADMFDRLDDPESGLRQNSLISCINLAVIPPHSFDTKIGELSDQAMRVIDECLKSALGIA